MERMQMVEELVTRGIRDERILAAMRKVPRHLFTEHELAHVSYQGLPLPIGMNQTITQPYFVAYMTEQLQVNKTHRVLEVGTGSGYQTAILAELAREVFTIERHAQLLNRARMILSQLRYGNIHYHIGDGSNGWPEDSRFDRIVVTAAMEEILPSLIEQLSDGGRLVGPIIRDGQQRLVLSIKFAGRIRRRELIPCQFVPLVTGGT